jgi:hypothetical protein
MQEVAQRFAPPPLSHHAGLDINLTPASVAALLQTRCHLVPAADNADRFYLPEGARIHTEDELSTMIGPDAVRASVPALHTFSNTHNEPWHTRMKHEVCASVPAHDVRVGKLWVH